MAFANRGDDAEREGCRNYVYDMLAQLATLARDCGEEFVAESLDILAVNRESLSHDETAPFSAADWISLPVSQNDESPEISRLAHLLHVAAYAARLLVSASEHKARMLKLADGIELISIELKSITT